MIDNPTIDCKLPLDLRGMWYEVTTRRSGDCRVRFLCEQTDFAGGEANLDVARREKT